MYGRMLAGKRSTHVVGGVSTLEVYRTRGLGAMGMFGLAARQGFGRQRSTKFRVDHDSELVRKDFRAMLANICDVVPYRSGL